MTSVIVGHPLARRKEFSRRLSGLDLVVDETAFVRVAREARDVVDVELFHDAGLMEVSCLDRDVQAARDFLAQEL